MSRGPSDILVALVLGAYRLALYLYPRRFRGTFASLMVDDARALLETAARSRGIAGVAAEAGRLAGDVVRSVPHQWIAAVVGGRGSTVHEGWRTKPGRMTGGGILDDLRGDLLMAARTLRRSAGFSAVVVATLAVGIGANVAMFSTIEGAFLRPLPFEDPDRLVVGMTTFDGAGGQAGSAPDYYDYRLQAGSYVSLAAYLPFPMSQPVTGGTAPELVPTQYVDWSYFRTLGVSPALGRDFRADEGRDGGRNVVLLSYGAWQRRFGGAPDVVGGELTVGGRSYAVVGVMPADFRLQFDVDIWLPMRPHGPYGGLRRVHNWLMVGRLAADVSMQSAQAEADLIYRRLETAYPDSNAGKGLRLQRLRDHLLAEARRGLLFLWSAVVLVLLIACGNVAGLLLARGSARRTELAVRSALGASRERLFRTLFAESLLLTLAGGVAGLLLAGSFHELLGHFLPLDLPGGNPARFSGHVLGFALVLTLMTGLVFGSAPALAGAGADMMNGVRRGSRSTDGRGPARLRHGLVVGQVALSVVLLVASGLLIRSFAGITGVDPGFDPHNLLTAEVRLPADPSFPREQRAAFFRDLLDAARVLPGVEAAALVSALPVANPGNTEPAWALEHPPATPADALVAFDRVIMPGYFETLGIPLIAGRSVVPSDDGAAPRVIVLSETMARRLFPDGSPLGQRVAVDMGGPEAVVHEVVGVAADVRITTLDRPPEPVMYFSYDQRPYSIMRLALRSRGHPIELAAPLRGTVRGLNPDVPVASLRTMDDVLANSVGNYKVMASALSLFAAGALLMAAMGLHGVLALHVTGRIREIGVRMALGADVPAVVGGVLRRGLVLVLLGIALGAPAALAGARLLGQLLYGVDPADPLTLAAVCMCFLLVSVTASVVPGLRAARVDPMDAFRAD